MTNTKYFTIPGYYSRDVAEKVKTALQGKGYMKLDVCVSNEAGNHSITVSTDHPVNIDEFRGMVYYILINELAKGGK